MNEDHIIAAILTAGLLAQNKEEPLQPKDVVSLYALCMTELLESNRAKREFENNN
jgi:hypothetical protein